MVCPPNARNLCRHYAARFRFIALTVYRYLTMLTYLRACRSINQRRAFTFAKTKLEMLHQTIETLTGAGYQYIGMDPLCLNPMTS